VKFIPPKITGSSITTSISKTEQFLNTNTTLDSILTDLAAFPIGSLASAFGLTSLGQSGTEQFSTTNPKLASNPGTTVSAQDATSTPQSDNNIGLFSTTNPVLTPNSGTGNAAGPTYNPPLKRCTTTDSANKEGGFDLAKYVITGKFDKEKLKGDDFAFQIFADLVDGDESEITGLDAPYKAKILTNNNGESPIDLYEIATVCIDTQHVINIKEKTEIDLDKSEVFKSLEF
jgi:hypothetical protein